VQLRQLGFAEKVTVKDVDTREDAVLMGGGGEKNDRVKERIEIHKEQLTEAKNDLTRMQLERRIANLHASVGVIRVGASTNAELLYLKLKIEDGVFACKAALQEGYVKGGGLCLKEISEELPENILTLALCAPYEQIQRNAGGYLDISDDVIDPARVVRLEVEHGVSVASSMITTGISIPERREYSQYDGMYQIAKAIGKNVYYTAKHHGLLKENQDAADADMEKAFEQAMFDASKD
jgi:chaperonin GroEL (HSP60 family)